MTITITTYTLAANWTYSDFFDELEQVYIDLGRHTAWHDRFASGNFEHAILQHNYDATKTYGQPYDEFIIEADILYYQRGNSWNSTSHTPNGTAFDDYFGTYDPASIDLTHSLMDLDTTTAAEFRLIQSGVDTDFGIIQFINGTDELAKGSWFHIPIGATFQSWIDFDVRTVNGTYFPMICKTDNYCTISFNQAVGFRRSYETGIALIGSDSDIHGFNWSFPQYVYMAPGRVSDTNNNWDTETNDVNIATLGDNDRPRGYIILPSSDSTHDSNLSGDLFPIYHGLQYSAWIQEGFPSDIGVWVNNIGPAIGDAVEVTAGSNEWEALWSRPVDGTDFGMASLVGRTV